MRHEARQRARQRRQRSQETSRRRRSLCRTARTVDHPFWKRGSATLATADSDAACLPVRIRQKPWRCLQWQIAAGNARRTCRREALVHRHRAASLDGARYSLSRIDRLGGLASPSPGSLAPTQRELQPFWPAAKLQRSCEALLNGATCPGQCAPAARRKREDVLAGVVLLSFRSVMAGHERNIARANPSSHSHQELGALQAVDERVGLMGSDIFFFSGCEHGSAAIIVAATAAPEEASRPPKEESRGSCSAPKARGDI
ncbi:hypothetical protein PHYPSEUDO_001661 [Phytophthora pseudosyringae]|uniref:Uncharacterized protein n=1 Tax=Phytophthora pseudosyringae TaxID=221518 RepID=A0A8T1VVI2_9STRA|nr:hypothetical protein PHYPSEUDO_001661 [Phytophthora pseudosyringae]